MWFTQLLLDKMQVYMLSTSDNGMFLYLGSLL